MTAKTFFTKNNRFWLAVAVVVVVGVAVGWTAKLLQQTPPRDPGTEVRVELTATGFEPKTLTVNEGTTVVWVNRTDRPMQLGANPYPDGTELPELKSDHVGPESSYSYTFGKEGNYGYTNYSDPTVGGSVQVKKK